MARGCGHVVATCIMLASATAVVILICTGCPSWLSAKVTAAIFDLRRVYSARSFAFNPDGPRVPSAFFPGRHRQVLPLQGRQHGSGRVATAMLSQMASNPSMPLGMKEAASSATIREADPAELANASSVLLDNLAKLVATCMYEPRSHSELATLSRVMRTTLVEAFVGEERRSSKYVGRSQVLLVEDGGELIGASAIQILPITQTCRGEKDIRSLSADERNQMVLRPLLSNVVVLPAYRRLGIASRLLSRAEALAQSWGYDELLLFVNEKNLPAQQLYTKKGYEIAGEPVDAETCVVAPWYFGGGGFVNWKPCRNICMRKLRLAS